MKNEKTFYVKQVYVRFMSTGNKRMDEQMIIIIVEHSMVYELEMKNE